MSSGKNIKIDHDRAMNHSTGGFPLNKARPDIIVEQPPLNGGDLGASALVERRVPQAKWDARKMMEFYGYDPVAELLRTLVRLEKELEFYDNWRAGKIQPLTASGRHKTYNQEVHMNLYDKVITVHDKLLRYGYSRVPEGVINQPMKAKPLQIVMHDDNKTFTIEEEND